MYKIPESLLSWEIQYSLWRQYLDSNDSHILLGINRILDLLSRININIHINTWGESNYNYADEGDIFSTVSSKQYSYISTFTTSNKFILEEFIYENNGYNDRYIYKNKDDDKKDNFVNRLIRNTVEKAIDSSDYNYLPCIYLGSLSVNKDIISRLTKTDVSDSYDRSIRFYYFKDSRYAKIEGYKDRIATRFYFHEKEETYDCIWSQAVNYNDLLLWLSFLSSIHHFPMLSED